MHERGEVIGTARGIGQWLTGVDGFDEDGGRPAPEKKRGARGDNDGEAAWPVMLHGGRNAEVAMAAVLGACSRALVARSRSNAVTARNGEMMERAKDRDDRDSMAMTAFVFTTAGREDEGEEDEMEHLASVSWQWGEE
uniref:DUF834 domain-containing protein n=1 Tax=Oryza rufipogon TaxID=4529 RepID=A0A0E0QB07_ORYRU